MKLVCEYYNNPGRAHFGTVATLELKVCVSWQWDDVLLLNLADYMILLSGGCSHETLDFCPILIEASEEKYVAE